MSTVLVTGCIGGRPVPELLDAGHGVRRLVRTPSKLRGIEWLDRVVVVEGPIREDHGAQLGDRHPPDRRMSPTSWRLDRWCDRSGPTPGCPARRRRAEMRLPGEAWMEWIVEDHEPGRSLLRQRAVFVPRGLFGRIYWYAVVPFHGLIFGRLAGDIARRAASAEGSVGSGR